VAAVLARGAHTVAGRFCRPLAHAPRRDEVRPPWEAVDVVAVVAPHTAADWSNTGHRLQQVEGRGIVWLSGFAELAFQVAEECSVLGDQGQVARDGLWDRQIGPAVGDAPTVRLGGALLADVGSVVWRVGLWHLRSACSACAPQVGAAPEPVTGGAPGSGVHIGVREQPPASPGSHVLRIELSIVGLAAMDGFQVAGVTPDNGQTRFRPHVGPPVPGQAPFARHHEALTRGRHGREERFWRGFHRAVQQNVPLVAPDADGPGAGMPVDPPRHSVLVGGEAPAVSSS
jgi:hypothetical protein